MDFDISDFRNEYALFYQDFPSIPSELTQEYHDVESFIELKESFTNDDDKELRDLLNNAAMIMGSRAYNIIEESKWETATLNNLEAQLAPFKTSVSTREAEIKQFELSQVPLTDARVAYLKAHVKQKYDLYRKWYDQDTHSRNLKTNLSRLHNRYRQQLGWLNQKLSNSSVAKSQLEDVVDQMVCLDFRPKKMNKLMERWPTEKDVVAYLTSKVKGYDEVSQSLLTEKERLNVLLESLERLIKDVMVLIDRLMVIREEYDVKLFRIFTIRKEHFPMLKECLFLSNQSTPDSRKFLREVTRFVPINKLRLLLAAQPISDITIVECYDQIQFAYLKVAEEGDILVTEDQWVKLMGPVKDQFDHDICWAFVTAELVSAVRDIRDYDTAKVEYSCQDLVDFVDPRKRSEEKKKKNKKHFCYTDDLLKAFEYVRVQGIEREESRPFEVECREEVLPRDGSNLGYIGDVVSLTTIKDVLQTLQAHPVAGSIPIFEPDYKFIKDQMYCGPTSPLSEYKCMHAINFVGAGGVKEGERHLNGRSSHGVKFGQDGYFKICYEHVIMCLTRGQYERYLEDPFLLPCQFVYPELLSREEEEKKRSEETNRDR